MPGKTKRRSFLKAMTLGGIGAAVPIHHITAGSKPAENTAGYDVEQKDISFKRNFNTTYKAEYLNRIAFPIGGIGAGMFCLEGSGAISHMSVRNKPDIFNEPGMFAAIHLKGIKNGVKVIEGPVPSWKLFGQKGTGNGASGSTFGLPRFKEAEFTTAFPYCHINLKDPDLPLSVKITGWSPFIPTDEDNSSLPAGALEYRFVNTGTKTLETVFSYNAKNFMATDKEAVNTIGKMKNGFVLSQDEAAAKPYLKGDYAIFTNQENTVVDYCWFRGGWWDPLTMAWNNVRDGGVKPVDPVDKNAPGASLYVPFSLLPGASKTIRLMMVWYVPQSDMHMGEAMPNEKKDCDPASGCCAGPENLGEAAGKNSSSSNYKPWYSSKFKDITEVSAYWKLHYEDLEKKSKLFTNSFYASTLPAEVMEAVAANLTIIKSPTVLRQYDGRLWCWEGCGDSSGCCHGSCTHVWNYAQAIPHLFPRLEKTLRNTEFCENQNNEGHQVFRANMPISPLKHDFHSAADGQLGGIMKVHRDWRISGDSAWMRKIYPMVVKSMEYCINTWDPKKKGVVEEPHHNTYDIEFWGADGMCTSFYLGALRATVEMGKYLKKQTDTYQDLYTKGKLYLESKLFNGEYFFQQIEFKNLNAPDPVSVKSFGGEYSEEAKAILLKEGPKYQYGLGCLSDGVLGCWIGSMCGLTDFIDTQKVKSHLTAIHKYNLKTHLNDLAQPQRPPYALGTEGGLL
ncbi:MAG: GH116 family glycosyl hydrolase, partial [Chitinophagaceae bacterium]